MTSTTFTIADIPITVNCARQDIIDVICRTYRNFLTACPTQSIRLHADYSGIPEDLIHAKPGNMFDPGAGWAYYFDNDRHHFIQKDRRETSSGMCSITVFDKTYSVGTLYGEIPRSSEVTSFDIEPLLPLEYPLGEFLIINLLGLRAGILLHAAAIDDNGRGYLFCGNSGHGKSTMAGLWKKAGAIILNDDRVAVRSSGTVFRMYGTPWHGTLNSEPVSGGLPLEKVFILRHGTANILTPMHPDKAAAALLTRSFIPLWDKEIMSSTLDSVGALVRSVQCFELAFIPAMDVLDVIRCAP